MMVIVYVDNDLFGRFLAERGGVGGVHHIAVDTPDFRRILHEQAVRGNEPILSGTFSGVECHYLSPERDLGEILEAFSGMPRKQTEERRADSMAPAVS